MKKKGIILSLFLMGISLASVAQTIKEDGVIYKVENGVAWIDGYDKKATSATIKAEVSDKNRTYEVAGVKKYDKNFSFGKLDGTVQIQELVIADGVEEVPYRVASSMTSLRRVVFQGNVKRIGEDAFSRCTNLKQIELPSTLKEIGRGAFNGCSSIRELRLPDGLEKICSNSLSAMAIEELVVPKSVTSIEMYAFSGNSQLKKVILLCDLDKLNLWLFQRCTSLKSLVVPNSVVSIDMEVFSGCSSLTDLVLPDNCTYVSEEEAAAKSDRFIKHHATFVDCPMLTNIKCHNGTVPKDIVKYMTVDCPFKRNGGVNQNPDFDKPLLAAVAAAANGGEDMAEAKPKVTRSEVDENIPVKDETNTNTFVVIIGNEAYKSVPPVSFAQHDAEVFAEYCHKTLGVPEKNISLYTNASYGAMLKAVKDLKKTVAAQGSEAKVMFYYSGHGLPNESTHDAFLLPIDADGKMTEVCYSVGKLYSDLANTGAKSVAVFLDACFSGAQRDGGVLQASARGVAIKANAAAPTSNMVVFSAATGDETAYPYNSKGHGMFTYYLLKKLQETGGDVTLGELSDYVKTEVLKSSIMENKKSQTPTVVASGELKSAWYSSSLK